ncbi:hypothetical protein CR513_17414, partial [Mucuna pruriens]
MPIITAAAMKFRCVRTTPLLTPVVPEEYRSAAVSPCFTPLSGSSVAGSAVSIAASKLFGDGDDELGVGIVDLLGEFRDGVRGIGSGDDGADCGGGEEAYREVDGVGREQENDVVFGYAEVEETAGKPGDLRFELGEGEGLGRVGVDEGGFVGERGNSLEEE